MSNKKAVKQTGGLVAIIADEDTVTGFLLAGNIVELRLPFPPQCFLLGVGNVDAKRKSNFLVVDSKTTQAQIEEAFRRFTNPDAKPPIGVLLIAQYVANEIRFLLEDYNQIIPAILEIPSKDHPYDPQADYLLARVKRLVGAEH